METIYNDLSLEDIHQMIQRINSENLFYRKENSVFQSYLKNVSGLDAVFKEEIHAGEGNLSSEQRFFITEAVLRDTREAIDKTKENGENQLEQLRVSIFKVFHSNFFFVSLFVKKLRYELQR